MNPPIVFQNAHLLALSRWLLAAIFLASALGKLRQPRRFVSSVVAYEVLPRAWAQPFAFALIGLEAGIAFLLLAGCFIHATAALCTLLLLSFIVAMGINLARGRTNLECGCFGPKHLQKIGFRLIMRDLGLLVLSLGVTLWGGGMLSFDQLPPARQQDLILQVILPLLLTCLGMLLLVRLIRHLKHLLLLAMEE